MQNLETTLDHSFNSYTLKLNGNVLLAEEALHSQTTITLDSNAKEIEKLRTHIAALELKNKEIKEQYSKEIENLRTENKELREKIQTLEKPAILKPEENEEQYQILDSGSLSTSIELVQTQSTQNEKTEFRSDIQENVSSVTQPATGAVMAFSSTGRASSIKQLAQQTGQQAQNFIDTSRAGVNNNRRSNDSLRSRRTNNPSGRGNHSPRSRGK